MTIAGLQIDVPSAEMKTLLEGRLQYHRHKVDAYHTQRLQLEKLEAGLDDEARQLSKTSNRSPLESIDESIKKHQNQVVYYKFMAEHVVPNETYRLSENDLLRIGVTDRHY